MGKNIKSNAILNLIKTISSIIFPMITFPYISRVLKPEYVGKINFGNSFVSYFVLIAGLGITTYAIRECSVVKNDRDKLEKVSSQLFSINVYSTIIAYSLMIITLLLFRRFDSYRTLIIIQSLTIVFTTFGCDWLNATMEDFRFITIRTIIFQAMSLVLMFIFVRNQNDYIKYAIIAVLSSSGANIANIFYRKKYCDIHFTSNLELKKHLKPILLLFVMMLAQTIFHSSDITMLGIIKGDYDVGLYSSSVRMSNLVSQIVASLTWVVMPRISSLFFNQDYEKINLMLKKVLGVLLTFGIPCTIGVICLSKEILFIIAGEDYVAGATSLRLLMICYLFSLFGGNFLGNMVLLPSQREGTYMKICCISTLVNLILNYFLIPIWGINAAAGTTAFSGFLILIMLLYTKDKRIRIDYMLSVAIPPIVGAICIIFVCKLCSIVFSDYILVLIVSIVVSAVLYLVIQLLMKNGTVIEILEFLFNKIRNLKKKGE